MYLKIYLSNSFYNYKYLHIWKSNINLLLFNYVKLLNINFKINKPSYYLTRSFVSHTIQPFQYSTSNLFNIQNYSQDVIQDLLGLSEEFHANYQEFEFIKDENFYELVCPKLYEGNNDPVLNKLANVIKIKDIFSILDVNKNWLQLQYAIQAIITLSGLKVVAEQNKLFEKFGGQSISKNVSEIDSKLKIFPEFNKLIYYIEDNIIKLTTQEMASTFMCLNHLGLPLHDNIMSALYLQIYKYISVMDLTSLTQVTFALRNKGFKAYNMQSRIISQIGSRYDTSLCLNDVQNIFIMLVNMKKLIPSNSQILKKYYLLLDDFLKKGILKNCSPSFKIMFLKYIHLLSKHNFPIDLCRDLTNTLLDDICDLSPGQIVTLNKSLIKQVEPRQLQFKLQEQASRIYDDYKDMDVQTDLLLCIASQNILKTKDFLEGLSLKKILLLQEHHNILSISRILRFVRSMDFGLFEKMWYQALEKVKTNISCMDDKISIRETMLYKFYGQYIYLNSQLGNRYRCRKTEKEVIELIQKELTGPSKLVPSKVIHMVGFLLAYSQDDLRDDIFELFNKNINQYNYQDIIFMSRCIRCYFLANDKNKKNGRIIGKVCKLLDEISESQIELPCSLLEIASFTRSLVHRLTSANTLLYDKLANEHLKYLEEMNSSSISIITKNFTDSSYSLNEVNEAISNYIIQNEESIFPRIISQTLAYFYSIGYHPSDCEKFTDASIRCLESTLEKIDCQLLIESCLALCYFRSLSPILIHYIFNEIFLDKLEEEIYSTYSKRYSDSMRSSLMKLNRAVCLDFPEEKIPWFHEKYCQQSVGEEESSPISTFHHEVYGILTTILGGSEFVNINRKSPYYYNLDLEFAIDKSGRPISKMEFNIRNTKAHSGSLKDKLIKRVAVQLRDDSCYCINKPSLTGPYQMERRHLELLGYAVVEVVEQSWYSMALTEEAHRKKYLESLINKELSRSN